jgi:hypothetical protein
MGTVRAWLRDDVSTPAWENRPTAYDPVPVATDDDPAPTTETDVRHALTVRLRTRTGYDDEGVPEFEWTVLIDAAEAALYEERDEFDADAGLTLVKATAVLLYDGPVQIPESASVTRDDGVKYRVLAVRQVPGRVEFDMQRIA